MPPRTFRISGHVIDERTRHGIPGLRVEAWDKDLRSNTLLGEALTDGQGAFHLEFTSASDGSLRRTRHPNLFFKVFQSQTLLKNTEQSVLMNLNYGDTNLTIEVKRRVHRRRNT